MYSRLHFANYSFLRIRDLSGLYRQRCIPQKKLCWHKEGGKYMSPPDRIIHFTGIFSLQSPGWRINTLSSSASGVYDPLLCLLWSANWRESRRERVVSLMEYHCDLFFTAFKLLMTVFDECFKIAVTQWLVTSWVHGLIRTWGYRVEH